MFFGGGFPFGFQQGHHDEGTSSHIKMTKTTNKKRKNKIITNFWIAGPTPLFRKSPTNTRHCWKGTRLAVKTPMKNRYKLV
jgi:hypothetical protein